METHVLHTDDAKPCVQEFIQRKRRLLPRWESPGRVYHVRSSLLRWRPERLTSDAIAGMFAEVLDYDDGRRYELHCYVLMPDHFHALLRPLPRGDGVVPLSEIMQAIKSVSARRVNRLSGRNGSLWLEDGYTRFIRNDKEYRATWRYIHSNPMRAGYIGWRGKWPWWWEWSRRGQLCADEGVRTTKY